MNGLLKLADVDKSSTMIALYPPEAWCDKLYPHASDEAWEDGLHMTLLYLGKLPQGDVDELVRQVMKAAGELEPIEMVMNGSGCFMNDQTVRLVMPNGVGLSKWRHKVFEACEYLMDPPTHGFIPHITLEYHDGELPVGWEQAADQTFPEWVCDTLYVVRGNEVVGECPVGP